MELLNTIAVLLTLAAAFSFFNDRFLKLPRAIGLVLFSLILSVAVLILTRLGVTLGVEDLVKSIDFNQTVLVGFLSFLLFAGALHVDLNDLLDNKVEIAIFATVGVLFSTLVVGSLVYLALLWIGPRLPFLWCLLFGALISPTDPIAVLGILKNTRTPKALKVKISGESLFNDGIGVVLFIVLLGLVTGEGEATASRVGLLLLQEVGGGAILGLAAGWLVYQALKRVDQYQVEVLITLALVVGGYALALNLHASGPIAIVIAGLFIGNHGRRFAMSDVTREHLDTFWELIDEILNAVLFVLIGLEILVISLSAKALLLALIAVPVVLLARLLSVGTPVLLLRRLRTFSPRAVRILTWAGLRGGISVALALSVPAGAARELFLTMTYAVVVFSLVVQGLTIKYLVPQEEGAEEDPAKEVL